MITIRMRLGVCVVMIGACSSPYAAQELPTKDAPPSPSAQVAPDAGSIVPAPAWGALPGAITLGRMREALSHPHAGEPSIGAITVG